MGEEADRLLDNDDYSEPREIECKRCGKAGLTWEKDGMGWVLVDGHSEIHRCHAARIAKLVLDDFDDISTRQDQS